MSLLENRACRKGIDDQMKGFERKNLLLSLCGLNCGLCPMYLSNYCPGCGGGPGNQACAIARCSLSHNGIAYCYLCDVFPCEKYSDIDEFDSFITHQNQKTNLQRAQAIGIDAYVAEQNEKIGILKFLLENYNDGRKKSFFCVAVNLLPLEDIKAVVEQLVIETEREALSVKEKAVAATKLFEAVAKTQGIQLKLHKKPSKK